MTARFEFQPHRVFRSGHAQTLAAFLIYGRTLPEQAVPHRVRLDDGDEVVLHDDRPAQWSPGNRAALIVHGVCGCHRSSYCARLAKKLNTAGIRTFRMDLRGCGAGLTLARRSYHGGCSDDLRAAVRFVESLCPGSPVAIVGFSLGGNIALKLLGESPELVPGAVDRTVAISAPVDILETCRRIGRGTARIYDRYFAKLLWQHLQERRRRTPGLVEVPVPRRPRSIWEFDDAFTAPVAGFGTAENYYRRCSSAPLLDRIRVPTLLLTAADDPMVPVSIYESANLSPAVTLKVTRHGGHLGFLARRNGDPDRHWMDWRVVDWLTH